MVRVFISPKYRGEDKGDGGIRRVVEAQHKWLPEYGIAVVSDPEQADVFAVHASNWYDTDKPIVAHCHGLYWEGYPWARWALAMNKDVIRTMKQADAITVPSDWVGMAVRRGLWAETTTLYHGIEPEDWPEPGPVIKKANNEKPYVLWNKTRVDAICDPEPVNVLASKASGVPFITTFGTATGNVQVTGPQPYERAKKFVQSAGVYLCTARETFGIGTLEAMAAGVPILGWKWGGQAEFVRHKKTGYLATPGDYDDLLAGLEFCLSNRQELGKNARSDVLADFTWEKRIKPYADLYKRLHEDYTGRPKVSVVITNYNLGNYLPAAVSSALQPTKASGGQQTEVIVVDDASTEPLPSLPAGVIVHRNKTNLYLSEALNVGIGIARGRYIIPLDADNQLAPGALDILSNALDKDRSLDIAYGKMEVTDEAGKYEAFVSEWPPKEASLDLQVIHRNQISSTAMYRRNVWERVGGYRRRCHTAEDADFWCRALAIGMQGRRVTDAVTLKYLDRSSSMSHVQQDWSWHHWYQWAVKPATRLLAANGEVPSHEFPLVSVVIPVGPGHERYVLDALDSLQAQSFKRWEAVVINDTGKELLWIHSWARVVTSKSRGAAHARNCGVKVSRGSYVLFLDADDWLHADALENMYDAITKDGGFVYSDWFVAETGEYKETPDFEPDMVLRQLPYPVTCMYSRKDLIDKNIKFDPSFTTGWEDWDFALQAIAREGLCGTRIKAPLFYYRLTTGTLREKAYGMRDELKHVVLDKWGQYINGEERNMARCGGCGGGSRIVTMNTRGIDPATTQADAEEPNTVFMEYIGTDSGTRSFQGRVTGNRYRFGNDDVYRVRRVREADVDGLMLTGFFKRIDRQAAPDVQPLQASGPPKRDTVTSNDDARTLVAAGV